MYYKIIFTNKVKNVNLKVDYKGEILVKAPLKTDPELINFFILKHKKWIENRLKAAQKYQKYNFTDGERLPFLDTCLSLNKKNQCAYTLELHSKHREKRKKQVINFYKEQLKKYINEQLFLFCSKHNLKYKSFSITSAKKRYGSCSWDKRLFFTWRLAMAPTFVVNYVIAHELAHTKYMNHSKEFWALVAKIYPKYKESINWLKENYAMLYLD